MKNERTHQPITKRYDFTILFDVTNGNPNGDPDAGNLPRMDAETGHGIVTDVCLKRKIRNYIEIVKQGAPGYGIYVTEGAVLNEQHRQAYYALRGEDGAKAAKLEPKDKAEARELTQWMSDNFFDVRTFGAVMSTKVNCGQVRGPVQFTFARSIDPIFASEVTITRQAVTQEGQEKDREMGRKHVVPYGLYRMNGFVSAHLADKTNFTEEDLQLLWDAIVNMFEHDRSASRGEMTLRKLVIFEHQSGLGQAPAHQLFDRITVQKVHDRPARSYKDYQVSIERETLPEGITIIEK
ncbi:type I-C CRISPR-associated protein Cas7/Csd2 [Paenibacillus faecalis]|uniref:type I-C CRISPR-associated protein Cas7/Csd2 n=1 Tax=Paenibacillus faecalis TaxID=2079532 RepID=UPI000D0E42CC|nr:type I-C CRISPR-associated protein Cas7/Csd2 [Paenibacillus faecalis]